MEIGTLNDAVKWNRSTLGRDKTIASIDKKTLKSQRNRSGSLVMEKVPYYIRSSSTIRTLLTLIMHLT